TNYHQLIIADAKSLADRLFAKEQLLYESVSDQADIHSAFRFGGSEVPAVIDSAGVDIDHVGGLTVEVHILGFAVKIARLNASRSGSACSHFPARSALLRDCLHVVELNLPVLQRLDDDVEVGYGERSA